uniref:Uncharacterized protein n=1 Tax=Setaria digitata TaxID=48799 RepID=A0A915Q2G3_9BILA
MTSGEDALRQQITELKEKIASVEHEMAHLQKRRRAYIAKMRLMNHLDGHHIKGDTEHTSSSDESFTTNELLELSLSSISSSILGSDGTFDDDGQNDSESGKSVENGQRDRHRQTENQKTGDE